MPGPPLTPDQRLRWDTDGWCMVEGLFSSEEVADARAAVSDLFPSPEAVRAERAGRPRDRPGPGGYDVRWDAPKPDFPFEHPALNRLCVHESLLDLADQLLAVPEVRLYQGMVSAKYADGHADHEQLLHVDYGNHTLVVPRTDPGYQHLEIFVYLSHVTPERAATRMVPRSLTVGIPVERTYLSLDEYASLYDAEEPAIGPAGSVLAYRPDTYHRGTVLDEEGSVRFLLHVAFKPVASDWLGYQAWPQAAERLSWHRFVPEATVRQLTALGFPAPGHPYWTAETLRGVQARYPRLDLAPWRQARPA